MRQFNVLTSTLPGARPTPGAAAALPNGGAPNDPFAKVLKQVASGHEAEAAVPLAGPEAAPDAPIATGPARPTKPAKSGPDGRGVVGGPARAKTPAAPQVPDQSADLFALADAASQPMKAIAPSSDVAQVEAPGPDEASVARQGTTVAATPPAVEAPVAGLAAGPVAPAAPFAKGTDPADVPPSDVTTAAPPPVGAGPSAVAAATVAAQAAASSGATAPPVSPPLQPAAPTTPSPTLSQTPAPDRGASDPSAVAAASAPVVAAAAPSISPKGPAPASLRASTVGATPQPPDETAASQPVTNAAPPLQAAASGDSSARRSASDAGSNDTDDAIDAATSIAATPAAPAPPPPVLQIVQALQGLGLDPAASGGETGSSPSTAAPSASAAATATPTSSPTLAASGGTVTIQLDPEHLGRVQITLRMQAGSVDIRIDVDNAQTLTLLNKDKHILSAAVEATGRSSAIDLAGGLAATPAPGVAVPAVAVEGADPGARQHLPDPSSSGRGDRQGDQSPPSNRPEDLRDDESVSIGDRPSRRSDSSLYL